MNGVTAQLDVKVSGGTVTAHLVFQNSSTRDQFLEKSKVLADGPITINVFAIKTGDQQIPYIGRSAKRGAPEPDDFLKLEPGKRFEVSVELSTVYDFQPGLHSYQMQYDAIHSTLDNKGIWALKSNQVTFTLRK